ncbi:MAG: NAD(P)/FAD-dependent oxidoreductase, partial [Deltaproteobacteria bacterium]|nr:NAD(P)/FAD-dependent oxidoreductase [Deltaproteobacteria bacterium]
DRGAEIRYTAQVSRFIIDGGRITGVELRNGETLTAKTVLSSLDARTTFSRLTGEENLPAEFNHSVREIQYTNGYLQIHMTLDELPEFEGHLAFTNKNNVRWLMAYIPSAEHLSDCWEAYRRNEVPEDPVAYCYFPSLMDPTLAPEGKHTCTIFSHYFPAESPKGKHNEYKELMAERAIEQIQKVAPNFRDAITGKIILTHEYFEKTFGITAGDFCHGLLHPGQMWENRPVPGYADYRTPIEGLYMCGASCHPGPGITCIPGYNGAHEVLADSKG